MLELLADTLGVSKSRLYLVRGHTSTSRDKVVAVDGLTRGEVAQRLDLQVELTSE